MKLFPCPCLCLFLCALSPRKSPPSTAALPQWLGGVLKTRPVQRTVASPVSARGPYLSSPVVTQGSHRGRGHLEICVRRRQSSQLRGHHGDCLLTLHILWSFPHSCQPQWGHSRGQSRGSSLWPLWSPQWLGSATLPRSFPGLHLAQAALELGQSPCAQQARLTEC